MISIFLPVLVQEETEDVAKLFLIQNQFLKESVPFWKKILSFCYFSRELELRAPFVSIDQLYFGALQCIA